MWHVSSRSGVATVRTAIHLLLTYLLTYLQGYCFSVQLWLLLGLVDSQGLGFGSGERKCAEGGTRPGRGTNIQQPAGCRPLPNL